MDMPADTSVGGFSVAPRACTAHALLWTAYIDQSTLLSHLQAVLRSLPPTRASTSA